MKIQINQIKKALFLFACLSVCTLIFSSFVHSQVPGRINYQTTVKDKEGNLLVNREVGARIKIITQDSEIFYQERHILNTNARGLATFIIGDGIEKKGNLDAVNWADDNNTLYVKIEIDPDGGKIYTIVNHNRIDPAPHAINARYVVRVEEKDPVFNSSLAAGFTNDLLGQYEKAVRERHYPGDLIAGGIVFYVDSTGQNGLLTSTRNIINDVPWDLAPFSSASATSVFDGEANTEALMSRSEPEDFAAYYCDTFMLNGKNDWYLPSSDELSLLFASHYQVNRALGDDEDMNTEGIQKKNYWSSTEVDSAHAVVFQYGSPNKIAKDSLAAIRPVRKFNGLYDVDNYSWTYLGGPEDENGDDVRIVENTEGDLLLEVDGSRGTVFRPLPATKLPLKITFKMKTVFDPGTSEPPTLLFGTGDFRLFFGGPNKEDETFPMNEGNLGEFEGVQFRIHPHLDESPIRRYTFNDGERESHTCTSIWMRNVDPDKRTDDDGNPHTGLVSDICQNRGNHCGWKRVDLFEDGLGLENGEETEVTIVISYSMISIEANGRVFSTEISDIEDDEDIEGEVLRFNQVTNFAIGHTNISRGYETIRISDVQIIPLNQTNE